MQGLSISRVLVYRLSEFVSCAVFLELVEVQITQLGFLFFFVGGGGGGEL